MLQKADTLSSNGSASKRKRDEERYYEPIRKHLAAVFANRYVDEKKIPPQYDFWENMPKYLVLEVVGRKNRFSSILKEAFDDNTLNIIKDEGIFPDLVGYVQKEPSEPTSQKEIIIVEVKDEPITLKMVGKTRLYAEIFNATFAFLLSTVGITPEKVRFLLKKPAIRGNVIVARFRLTVPGQNVGHMEINPKFRETVPEAFRWYCIPREYQPQRHEKRKLLRRFLKR